MQPTASCTPAGAEVDLEHAGGVRQIPQGDRARRCARAPSRPRRSATAAGAVVDDRAHHHRDVVEVIEVVAHAQTRGPWRCRRPRSDPSGTRR